MKVCEYCTVTTYDCDNTYFSMARATASWSFVSSITTSAAALAGAPALATATPSPANCAALQNQAVPHNASCESLHNIGRSSQIALHATRTLMRPIEAF